MSIRIKLICGEVEVKDCGFQKEVELHYVDENILVHQVLQEIEVCDLIEDIGVEKILETLEDEIIFMGDIESLLDYVVKNYDHELIKEKLDDQEVLL